jgi:anti-sigma-K factor RskA
MRRSSSGRARRWQLAGLLVVIAAVLAAVLAFALAHHHAQTPPGSGGSVSGELVASGGTSLT